MDCKEALTLISAAVDREIKGSKLKEFNEHISACINCRAEYEAEKATKDLLRTRLKRVKAPQSLIDSIRKQTLETPVPSVQQFSMHSEGNILIKQATNIACGHVAVAQHFPKWKLKLADLLFMEPSQSHVNSAFAFGLAASILAMLVFTGFMRNQQVSFMDGEVVPVERTASNIIEMTVNAFESGGASANLKSLDPLFVSAYLSKVIGSDVTVPVADGFRLRAVHLTHFGAASAAELRYIHANSPDTRFSVFVINQADLNGTDYVPIKEGSHFIREGQNPDKNSEPVNKQVIVWSSNNTVYTAIANNEKVDLHKTLGKMN